MAWPTVLSKWYQNYHDALEYLQGVYQSANLQQELWDTTYNDGSAHIVAQGNYSVNNASGMLIVNDTHIPFWANGGTGVAFRWTVLDPDTGWQVNFNGAFSFTDASAANTYSVTFSGGDGSITIQRTAGATAYRVRVFRFPNVYT